MPIEPLDVLGATSSGADVLTREMEPLLVRRSIRPDRVPATSMRPLEVRRVSGACPPSTVM